MLLLLWQCINENFQFCIVSNELHLLKEDMNVNYVCGDQIPSLSGRKRRQMPGVCPGEGCLSFDLTDTLSGEMVALVRKRQYNFRNNIHDFVRKYTISLKNI